MVSISCVLKAPVTKVIAAMEKVYMYDHMNGQHDYPELDQLTILSQTRMLQ